MKSCAVLVLLIIGINFQMHSQNIDLNNSTDYIRIQKNGESGFSRAFGLNSYNHLYIGSVEKTIGNIYFFNKGINHLMTITPSGNVGIGTTNPNQKIHVDGAVGIGRMAGNFPEGLKIEYVDGGVGTTIFKHNRWGGDIYFKRNSPSGERKQFFFGGSGNHIMTIYNGNDEVKVKLNSGGNSYLNGGNVGIGTTTPDAKLTVKGNIHTQEVKVDLAGAVAPDYVFKDDYNLKTLEEVETYINENGHLPNVLSAKTMEEEGINLKEMNLKLLEKVEELTLYVIELKKGNNEQQKLLEKQNEIQSKAIQELKEELNQLKNKL
ncbi:hypothetical protein [Joostella sp. CR20]|uniref:hypothetical protein n=1 Tax=Joostella sp. CR20 TaxID=2804312 RepID=UPI00313CFE92